jgi:hypothetical protein
MPASQHKIITAPIFSAANDFTKRGLSGIKAGMMALIICFLGMAESGAAPGWKILSGHVPPPVQRLTPIGRLPGTSQLWLAIGLPLRNQAGLDELLQQLYDPASPNFRKYLTPAEFTARFGPTEVDYALVKEFARTNGLVITATHANRLLLDVTGPATAVENAFHISLRTYRHPNEARDFFAPDTEPTVDAALPVVDIQGLSNFSRPQPNLVSKNITGVAPKSGSAPDGFSYFGNDFRNAYVPGTTLTGAGQMVGLAQFDGFYASDIAAYATAAGGGRTNIVIQTVLVDNYSGSVASAGGNAEVSLDIEDAMAMAPGLAKIMVFEGNPNNFIPNDVLNQMAANSSVKNLSSSWSWSGGPSTSTDNIFKTMAAQGQSYFNASGDSDAFPAGYVDSSSNTTTPGSSPYITQVGGTLLSTTSAGGDYSSESVWNRNNGVGSSGGVSTAYSIPYWQLGISAFASNGGSPTARNIPDVALTAEYVYVKLGNGSSGSYGGTSCAAPLWAGFMALVNQQAVATGNPVAGFINPAIYELANENIYNSVFHDTTSGNNTSSASPNAFYAGPGYDLCTGLGTPNGTNLINALANPDPLVVISNIGFTAVGLPTGGFNLSSESFTLTNISASPLPWSLMNTSAWLNVSLSGGTLAAGANNAVVVSLNTVASNLDAGTYSATLWFSNVNSGVAHSRFFTLKASDSLALQSAGKFSFFGPSGGPFTPSAQSIVLANIHAGNLNWSLNNTSAWFNVSPASGSLTSGTQTNVTFTLAPAATNLADGTYSALFQVTNLNSQFVQVVTGSVIVSESLVQNGGFETGDFTGWTLNGSGGQTNFVAGSSSISGITPHTGSYYAALGQPGSQAYLLQTLPTVAGQLYQLTLSLSSPNLRRQTLTPNEFSVAWNGGTLFDQSNIGKIGWTNLQFVVAATSSNTVLQIGGRDDFYHLGLDDVSVVPGFAPFIAASVTNLTIFSGSSVTLSATVTGTTNLVYQWRKNGANLANGSGISGATSNVLTLTAVTTNSSGNYTLTATNIFGATTTNVANLTVVLPAAIASSTVTNRTIQCGSNNLAFTVTATGTPPLNYQWSYDGMPIPGATANSYSVTNLHLPNHTITVTVTNLYASVTNSALVTVIDTLAPVIALVGSNIVYVELGGAFTDPGATAYDTCAGAVPVAIIGAVNPNSVGTNTLIYTANDGNGNTSNVPRTVIVRDTTPPTILWSFTNLVFAASTNCNLPMPDLTGTNFILATDLSGALTISQNPTNNFLLPVGTNTVVITVQDASSNAAFSTNTIVVQDQMPPVILTQPQDSTNVIGDTATFSVAAAACTPLTFQWYSNNIAMTDSTNNSLSLPNLSLPSAGNYYVVASASGGATTSAVVTLAVNLDPTSIALISTENASGFNDNLNLTASITPPNATGTIQFFTNGSAFDSENLIAGLAVSTNITSLPRGTNLITAIYAGDANDLSATNSLLQIVTNHPPVAAPAFYTRGAGTVLDIAPADLATNWSDADGDIISLAAIGTSTNGVALTNDAGTIVYFNSNNVADQFVCTISDNFGGTNFQTVNLAVAFPAITAVNPVAVSSNAGFNLNLTGSPGYTYVLEATTNLFSTTDWLPLATNTLGTNGVWSFTDTSATNFPEQFYRLRLAP